MRARDARSHCLATAPRPSGNDRETRANVRAMRLRRFPQTRMNKGFPAFSREARAREARVAPTSCATTARRHAHDVSPSLSDVDATLLDDARATRVTHRAHACVDQLRDRDEVMRQRNGLHRGNSRSTRERRRIDRVRVCDDNLRACRRRNRATARRRDIERAARKHRDEHRAGMRGECDDDRRSACRPLAQTSHDSLRPRSTSACAAGLATDREPPSGEPPRARADDARNGSGSA